MSQMKLILLEVYDDDDGFMESEISITYSKEIAFWHHPKLHNLCPHFPVPSVSSIGFSKTRNTSSVRKGDSPTR